MAQRPATYALILLSAASGLIGCSKSDNTPSAEAKPAANAASVQMNISGAPPVTLTADNIHAEIDKAGAGVKLVRLDLTPLGLPLVMDAPEGAKAQFDPRAVSFREWVDVEVNAGDRFALRIRLGKRPLEQKRQRCSAQQMLINTKDLMLSASTLLLDERCEFARHVVAGLQDYTVENNDPILGKQINHNQADCLLMLKCAATLAPRTPPPDDPLAALQQCNAAVVKNKAGQVINVSMDPRQTTDATLAPLAKLPALERLILHRCAVTDEGLTHLAKLTTLKELTLADCPISDAGLSLLSGLVNLEKLNLASAFGDSPRIKGDGLAALAGLTKLRVLVLDKNLIDDAGLSGLKNLRGLREVYLEQTRVVGPGLANLKALPELKLVSLNETKIADAGLEALQGVSSLEVLSLRGSQVEGNGLQRLQGLTHLHTLNLGNTPLSDERLTGLNALKSLKRVSLVGTQVTEAGADKLKASLPGVEVTLK